MRPRKSKEYLRFSSYLKKRFKEKVRKIPLDLGLTCPNRDGTLSNKGCIFCDEMGSGTGLAKMELTKQIEYFLEKYRKKNIKKVIAYFQAFTNTYCTPEFLKQNLEKLLGYPQIVLTFIGTRPDYVSKDHIEIISNFNNEIETWVELGLQSARDETLKKINRHHTYQDFETTVMKLREKQIPVTAHIIIGLPGETIEDNIYTAEKLKELEIESVKIHQLYIVKGTTLHEMYERDEFQPISFEEAIKRTIKVLEILPPNTIIQRLTGDPKPGQLIAPAWILNKNKFINGVRL